MKIIILEFEGLKDLISLIRSLRTDCERDQPEDTVDDATLLEAEEVLENYLGIENSFSSTTIKALYEEVLVPFLDIILGKNRMTELMKNNCVKSAQWCVDFEDTILLFVGDKT